MEQERAWQRQCRLRTYTVDSFAEGIAFGQHGINAEQDPREVYGLRLHDDCGLVRLRSRYALHKSKPLYELERHLMMLSQQGVLRSSVIYLGTTSDPFHPFDGKFNASMKFLELFLRYVPGMLCVQTRSPLIVLALPVFKTLGDHVQITFALETPLEESVRRYTPGLPRVDDRLRTIDTLRRFGIPVALQVSPVLPYGDWKGDAGAFADLLIEHGDSIYVRGLSDGTQRCERRTAQTTIAKKLAGDRRFHWLRADSARPLISELEARQPEKLQPPIWKTLQSKQMEIFAA